MFERWNSSMKRCNYALLADNDNSGHILHSELKRKGITAVILLKANEKMASNGSLWFANDAYRLYVAEAICLGQLKE